MADDFNRANNTDIGPKWWETAGDSAIVSNQLQMPASAIVIGRDPNPLGEVEGGVNLLIRDPQPGDSVRVCINMKTDATYYVAAQADFNAASQLIISTIERTGGAVNVLDSNTIAGGYTAGVDHPVGICRSTTGAYAGAAPSILTWACPSTDYGYRHAGIINNSHSNLDVDNYSFTREYHKSKICIMCDCECDGECLPKILNLIFSASGSCSHLDGVCIPLLFDQSQQPLLSWTGKADLLDWTGTFLETWEFFLTCNFDSSANGAFTLCITSISSSGCSGGWQSGAGYCASGQDGALPSSIICNPIELTYGPFSCTGTPPEPFPECDYSIHITPGACP